MAPVECYLCAKQFKMHSEFEHHLTQHTLECPFLCSQQGCSASYRTKQGRNFNYIARHPSIKLDRRGKSIKHLCYICSNEFKSLCLLYLHLRVHTHEFRFNCIFQKCKQAFSTKEASKSHGIICDYNPKCRYNYKKRTNEFRRRTFVCYFCGVTYQIMIQIEKLRSEIWKRNCTVN